MARRISIVRFSLRSLFVLVTAICLFLAFLTYDFEWIKKRRAFVGEQWQLHREIHMKHLYNPDVIEGNEWRDFRPVSILGQAPQLLLMFGEYGYPKLYVILVTDLSRLPDGTYSTSRFNPTLQTARKLFPEARVTPFIDKTPDGVHVFEEVRVE